LKTRDLLSLTCTMFTCATCNRTIDSVELQDALATYILEFVPRTFKSQIRMIVISFWIDANIIANPEVS